MTESYVFQCCKCNKINVASKLDADDVILQCWHCELMQIPLTVTEVTPETVGEIISKQLGNTTINPRTSRGAKLGPLAG